MSPSQATRKSQRNKADAIFSTIIRARGSCARCHGNDRLQCAHIVSRKYLQTRWDEDNALCLCVKCHLWSHHYPLEWEIWRDRHISVPYRLLKHRALGDLPIDYPAIIERLNARLIELEAAS